MSESVKERLLELLRTRAFQRREVTLSSGKKSGFYVDGKRVTLTAEGHHLIGTMLFCKIREYEQRAQRKIAAVGGLTLGADPIASAVSLTSFLREHPIPAFIVRKEDKQHGTGGGIEGLQDIQPGQEVVVVEDVVTTGASALVAVERLRSSGYEVRLVLGIVDRLEGGRAAMEAANVEMECLFDRRDFLSDADA